MSRKKNKITGDNAALATNPFASALGGLAGVELEATPAAKPEADPPPLKSGSGDETPLDLGRRAVVRRQSKGQGGKTVTCVDGIPLATAKAFLPQLKKELGCGGRIQDEMLVLGTRNHARVADWLQAAGVPRVTLGN
ncbi:MAG: translation initiation factor [Nannocystaceae bacterium]|nr:translation initiation factor [Nannocystaceae bacterium]